MKAYDKIKSLNNETLVSVLSESREISNSNSPRHKKRTQLMTELIDLEKNDYTYWYCWFVMVRTYIEAVVIDRVINGELK